MRFDWRRPNCGMWAVPQGECACAPSLHFCPLQPKTMKHWLEFGTSRACATVSPATDLGLSHHSHPPREPQGGAAGRARGGAGGCADRLGRLYLAALPTLKPALVQGTAGLYLEHQSRSGRPGRMRKGVRLESGWPALVQIWYHVLAWTECSNLHCTAHRVLLWPCSVVHIKWREPFRSNLSIK
jgi:hypothetical protein